MRPRVCMLKGDTWPPGRGFVQGKAPCKDIAGAWLRSGTFIPTGLLPGACCCPLLGQRLHKHSALAVDVWHIPEEQGSSELLPATSRYLLLSSPSAGAAARAKDPPWMALVQAEPKKKPAPPPPPPGSGHETPSRTEEEEEDGEEVGKAKSEESKPDAAEPKPYNPFEEEEEEEEEVAAAQKSTPEQEQGEAAAKSLHPWYGITPTSSPKAKKRPAPRAPSASPLGELSPTPLSLLLTPSTRS